MPVGGAEVLLQNLVTRIDRKRIAPEIVCLKERGPLGEQLSGTVPVTSNFLRGKWDIRVFSRLVKHFRKQRTAAVVTIGAGDKMFWGRLAAKAAGVRVICSALHSTGWPDGVGRLNRLLTPITDAFIAVANDHAQFLVNWERFPRERVVMIPNGVDVDRFHPDRSERKRLRDALEIPHNAFVVGIVAALRSEKNHSQFIHAAHEVVRLFPQTHFVVVGDGPERPAIEAQINVLGLHRHVHMLGTRSDTPQILAGLDVFALTSKNEANPVSILEALSCGIPVVSPQVGSVHETVLDETTGFLTEPGNAEQTAVAIGRLLGNPSLAQTFGRQGREHVCKSWSLDKMVREYDSLLTTLSNRKIATYRNSPFAATPPVTTRPSIAVMEERAATPAPLVLIGEGWQSASATSVSISPTT